MDQIFSGVSAILGVLCIYIVIRNISGFKYEYKDNHAYVAFHVLGVLLLLIAFVEMVMFFLNLEDFIIFNNIGVCIQLLLLGYIAIGQSEKYFYKEYCRRENLTLDTHRIRKIDEIQIAIVAVIIFAFWL